MWYFSLIVFCTAILVLILQKVVTKLGSWLLYAVSPGAESSPSQLLVEQNLQLKCEIRSLKGQLAEVMKKQSESQQFQLNPKSVAKSSQPSHAAVLDHVTDMMVYKAAEGGSWHADEDCVAKRSHSKVQKLKPCTFCVPKLRALF